MARRTQRNVKCAFTHRAGNELWSCRSYAYLAKRLNKLYVNVLIEDVNSKNKDNRNKHNWILSYCVVTSREVDIRYSLFNNGVAVELTEGQKNLTELFAREIYKQYFS